jgi:hypothetical protein
MHTLKRAALFLLLAYGLASIGTSVYFNYCFFPSRGAKYRLDHVPSAEQLYFEKFGRFASYEDLSAFYQTLHTTNIFKEGIVEHYRFESLITSNSYRVRAYPRSWCFCRAKLAVDNVSPGPYVFD